MYGFGPGLAFLMTESMSGMATISVEFPAFFPISARGQRLSDEKVVPRGGIEPPT